MLQQAKEARPSDGSNDPSVAQRMRQQAASDRDRASRRNGTGLGTEDKQFGPERAQPILRHDEEQQAWAARRQAVKVGAAALEVRKQRVEVRLCDYPERAGRRRLPGQDARGRPER